MKKWCEKGVHPGRLLSDRMESKNWDCARLSKAVGYAESTMAKCIRGKYPMSLRMAEGLEKAGFGRCEMWLVLQSWYDLQVIKMVLENKEENMNKNKLRKLAVGLAKNATISGIMSALIAAL